MGGKANLFPDAEVPVPAIHAKYQREGQAILEPDDATDYIGYETQFRSI